MIQYKTMKKAIFWIILLSVPFVAALLILLLGHDSSPQLTECIFLYTMPVWLPCTSAVFIKLGAILPSIWAEDTESPKISNE